VSFGERLRAWLRGESAGSSTAASAAARAGGSRRGRRAPEPSSALVAEIEEFVRTRHGVEVYLEPRTRLYGDSVLLVADDGEYLRRSVSDPTFARALCKRMGVPCYDAARTGYPRRVRDYDKGVRPQRIALEDLPPWPDAAAPGTGADTNTGTDENGGGSSGPDDLTDDEPPPPPPAG